MLLAKLFGLINERALRLMYLAGAVKVSERQFPHIYALVEDGVILDLPDVPDVFVMQNPIPNAMAIGRDRPFIVMTTGLVNLHDEEELRWVVGHELGHVLSGHAVYRTMLLILIQLAARIAWMPIGYLGLRAIIWGLEEWFRKSELSCDRAGLLAGSGRRRGASCPDEAGLVARSCPSSTRTRSASRRTNTTRCPTCGTAC